MGRRAPSFALVGGLGLLGLLITVAIMAILANRVLSGTDDAADVIGGSLPAELTTTVPGQTAVPGQGSEGGDGGGGLSSIGESSNATVCQVNRGVLEVAAQAYEISYGSAPVDQQQLLDSGMLSEPVPNFTVSSSASGVVITGEGICEGL